MQIKLNASQKSELYKQDPHSRDDGGFQSLLVSLQDRVDAAGQLDLTDSDLERIPRYAFDYGNGGWENRLVAIFGPHLGPKLGR